MAIVGALDLSRSIGNIISQTVLTEYQRGAYKEWTYYSPEVGYERLPSSFCASIFAWFTGLRECICADIFVRVLAS